MSTLLDDCQWPDLTPPYDQALRDAVRFILARFAPLGIIASGTIIRGTPGPSSDLDIYVIHAEPKRQRIQKQFNGVPAEIFVNPRRAIEGYFVEEQKAARPLTAHMLATGFVVLARAPVVAELIAQAKTLLASPPPATEANLRWQRYGAALEYEDALDVADADPATANMILDDAVHNMLRYHFRQRGQFIPRDKDLFATLDASQPELARLAREFYLAHNFEWRLALAEDIAERTIKVTRFFEWESALEAV